MVEMVLIVLNLIKHTGGVLESSWWAESKNVIRSSIWPSFHGENTENILLQTLKEIAGIGTSFRHSHSEMAVQEKPCL